MPNLRLVPRHDVHTACSPHRRAPEYVSGFESAAWRWLRAGLRQFWPVFLLLAVFAYGFLVGLAALVVAVFGGAR